MKNFFWTIILTFLIVGGIYWINQGSFIFSFRNVSHSLVKTLSDKKNIQKTNVSEEKKIKVTFLNISNENVKKGIDLALINSGVMNIIPNYQELSCNNENNELNRIIEESQIIIGDFCKDLYPIVNSLSLTKKVIFISTSSDHLFNVQPNDFVFYINPSKYDFAFFDSKYLISKNYKNIALLYEDNEKQKEIIDFFKKSFYFHGGENIILEPIKAEEKNLNKKVIALKNKKPQALYFLVDNFQSFNSIFKQTKNLKWNVPLFISANLKNNELLKNKEFDKVSFSQLIPFENNSFNESFKAKFKENPSREAKIFYDAFWAVLQALANNSDIQEVKNILNNIDFNGASNYIKFEEGIVHSNFEVLTIQGGKFVKENQ